MDGRCIDRNADSTNCRGHFVTLVYPLPFQTQKLMINARRGGSSDCPTVGYVNNEQKSLGGIDCCVIEKIGAIESDTFEAFADIQGIQRKPETEGFQSQDTDAQELGPNVPEVQNGENKIAVSDIGEDPNQTLRELLDDQSGKVPGITSESDGFKTEALPHNTGDVSYVEPGSDCTLTDSCGDIDTSLPME